MQWLRFFKVTKKVEGTSDGINVISRFTWFILLDRRVVGRYVVRVSSHMRRHFYLCQVKAI
jgi:hypothetical protein